MTPLERIDKLDNKLNPHDHLSIALAIMRDMLPELHASELSTENDNLREQLAALASIKDVIAGERDQLRAESAPAIITDELGRPTADRVTIAELRKSLEIRTEQRDEALKERDGARKDRDERVRNITADRDRLDTSRFETRSERDALRKSLEICTEQRETLQDKVNRIVKALQS